MRLLELRGNKTIIDRQNQTITIKLAKRPGVITKDKCLAELCYRLANVAHPQNLHPSPKAVEFPPPLGNLCPTILPNSNLKHHIHQNP